MKLEETDHSYSCECWEGRIDSTIEFESWKEFTEYELPINIGNNEGCGYDFDYNLPFRFDIYEHEEYEKRSGFYLELHHALQRHGTSIWHAVVYNLTEDDMPEIESYLAKCKKFLMDLWKEVPDV